MLELILSILIIAFDLFIPTLLILALAGLSLIIRREKISELGFKKIDHLGKTVLNILFLIVVWQLFYLGLLMPVLNRLTHSTQDLSAFANLQGNVPQLLMFLLLSWTLAAGGEEIVYRGFIPKKISDLIGARWGNSGALIGLGVSALLFGLAHTEQGLIGVILTTLDALFFSWIKMKFGHNLWAAMLAHGLSNSIGMIAFFYFGPIYGFW